MIKAKSKKYVIIGAGIHGLSTAWHLAKELESRNKGSGKDIIILEKSHVGAGATGVACGNIRNFYMTEEIHPLLRHSLDVWMTDPINLGFQQVGYISCGEANQADDFEKMYRSHNSIGYTSNLYVGKEAKQFLKTIWPDFKTDGIEVALDEKLSGYAGTQQVLRGLVEKCELHNIEISTGIEVTGYNIQNGEVNSVITNKGIIQCDMVIWGLGAWTPRHWELIGMPATIDCSYTDGSTILKDMWTYWRLREGEIYFETPYLTSEGKNPPILHIEKMNSPVFSEETGEKLDDYLYVYFKNANERMNKPGLQGGITPVKIGPSAVVDPYGHTNDLYQAEPEFADYFCAAMGATLSRFEGCRSHFRTRRNGGIGAFTPDNLPIIDWLSPNIYMIADSNHGFKMIGIGKLVARLLMGERVPDLEPFSFSRYTKGKTFSANNSHSPWV